MSTREQILELFLSLDTPHRLTVLDELITFAGQGVIANSDSNIGKENEIPNSENENTEKPIRCPECESPHIIKWGTQNAQHRFRCKNCNHTFTDTTFNLKSHIHKRSEFDEYGKSMFDGQYSTLESLSEKFNICTKTAFNWRHKYLSAINIGFEKAHFSGITEIDDVWVAFNEKGREGKENHRKRGGQLKPGDNDLQVKVLFTSSRKGDTDISVVRIGRLHKKDVQRAVGGCFENDAMIVCDKHPSILAFAKAEKIECESFEAKRHVRDKVIHVQRVNNMAQRFDEIINKKMNGVATK
jgi:transposase-like protein